MYRIQDSEHHSEIKRYPNEVAHVISGVNGSNNQPGGTVSEENVFFKGHC